MIKKIFQYVNRKILIKNIIKEKSLSKKFTRIYKINYWSDRESVSGPGSNYKNTKKLIIKLKKVIKTYKIKSIIDAPCGDFNWMKKIIIKNNVKYNGIDIVKDLIKRNKKLFSNKRVKFNNIDITKKKLPRADLLICRDFLFHLSYSDIKKFFKNLKNSNIRYILTSSHVLPYDKKKIKNKDIISGNFRKINLFDKPFNFNKSYETAIQDNCDGAKKYLILFKKKNINKSLTTFSHFI